ncbi:MAG: phosphoribosylglycinamide formyltransferase [Bacteroidales bacterium]|nr:phosphoribosylglycinamide formyltransferase [Bacteroidales bacterium]
MKNIAIFASGTGSNAENIINFFKDSDLVEVKSVFCNNPKAGVLDKCDRLNIPTSLFTKQEFNDTNKVIDELHSLAVDYIILAGFLLLLPENLIKEYNNRIINIHPSLLPKYGGKGMYGMNVHNAVISNQEKESGITIHLVNEKYDEGKIIFQATCALDNSDNTESLAHKIHDLEQTYFPQVIFDYISKF